MPGNGKNAVEWLSADKFGVVLETARMNEAELAQYWRSKGLFVGQVADWRDLCQQAKAAPGELCREFRDAPARVLKTSISNNFLIGR